MLRDAAGLPAHHVRAAQRAHLAPLLLGGHPHGGDPQSRGQDTVEAGGRATALDVTQDRVAGLDAGVLLDLPRHEVPDAPQPRAPGRLGALARDGLLAVVGDEALRHDNER